MSQGSDDQESATILKAYSSWTKFWYCFFIVLVGFLIYANTMHYQFIYDDSVFIVHNSAIYHLSDFKSIINFNPRRWVGTWTFALNYALGGFDVRGYHLVNILIHSLCGLAVWWFLRLILSVPKFSALSIAAEKDNLAFWAALLFITHPVQTMAVDQITQRYTCLAALFYLSSLCFYFKGRLSKHGSRWVYFVASGLAGFLSFYTREATVTLCLAVLLCEWLILDGFKAMRLSLKYFYWVIGIALCISGVIVGFYHFNILELLTSTHFDSQSHDGDIITSWNYFLTQFRVFWIYLRVLFWPVGLNFDYDMPVSLSFFEPGVLIGCLAVILSLIFAWRIKSKYPLISFGIFWFFLTLSVESTIFPIPYVVVEYRLYLPLVGICIALVPLMRSLIPDRKIFFIIMGSIVFIFSLLVIQRNLVYKDELSLWTDTAKNCPNKARPYEHLGSIYLNQGDYPKAMEYFHKALALKPDDYGPLVNISIIDMRQGDFDKALEINQALLLRQPSSQVYNNLGLIYYQKHDLKKAEEYFSKAITGFLSFPEAYFNLASVLINEGKIKEAIGVYLKELSQYPQDNKARYALIPLYFESQDIPKAQSMVEDVLASQENDPEALVDLGQFFASKGDLQTASDLFVKAVSVDYKCADAYIDMGKLLYNLQKKDKAIQTWQLGLKYVPDDKRLQDLIAQVNKA